MIENSVSVPLPADLPENWTDNQYVSPEGVEVGLTPQHGYNYLMKQVNNSQKAIKQLSVEVQHASADLTAPGWYRVAECSDEYSSSFELALGTVYHTHFPTSCVVTVGRYWSEVALAQQLVTAVGVIPKIRIVHNPSGGGAYYVEVYYIAETSNVAKITIRNFHHIDAGAIVEAIDFEPGSIPAGYTSVEFELGKTHSPAVSATAELVD